MSKFDFLDRFNKQEPLEVDSTALADFAEQIGGEIIATEEGSYLQADTRYNYDFFHGNRAVTTVLSEDRINLDCFETSHNNGFAALNDMVFIDAETTGLSAASGTVAFLVGVGFCEGDSFVVRQFFLPDYPDEPAMLDAIADMAAEKGIVVSFNGKAFDLPLLETRYTMQRRSNPFAEMHHIDLLHCSRRFWRGRFNDTTLQTLERELLEVHRYNDTPGYLIPQLYFDFLRHGYAGPLSGVLLHNRLDIVSLLYLLHAIQKYLDDAERYDFYSPADALAISKFLWRKGLAESSCNAAASQFPAQVCNEADEKLGFHLFYLQKRLKQFDSALDTLQSLRKSRGEKRLLVLEELAKLHEHKRKDFARARDIVLEALEYIDNPLSDIPLDRVLFWSETLQKRRKRLLRRLQ